MEPTNTRIIRLDGLTERIERLHPDAARRLGVPVQDVRLTFLPDSECAVSVYAMDGERLGGCLSNGPDSP